MPVNTSDTPVTSVKDLKCLNFRIEKTMINNLAVGIVIIAYLNQVTKDNQILLA